MRSLKLLTPLYLLVIIGLFFFSFTQVDLSLTLSRASFVQTIEKSFQQIGYFNRPMAAFLYVVLVGLLTAFYVLFLRFSFKNKLAEKKLWGLIIGTAVILAFSYNAFSYDLFNYIFDAKIITLYHQNPYLHKALDFQGDPMLSFMQWTHRYYPYGPVWLAITTPLSFIGSNIFLITFFLFKFLAAGFYLGSAYLVSKINKKILPEQGNFNLVLFALNPLVIMESLVSGHNDIAMIFFALLGIHLLFNGKKLFAIIAIIISSQIKIPTIALLAPLLLSVAPISEKIKLDTQKLVWLSIVGMSATFLYALTKLEVQPWYFLWILPFIALLKPNKYVITLAISFSVGLVLRYSVFFYFGNWDGIALPMRNGITIAAVSAPLAVLVLNDLFKRFAKRAS